MEIKLSTHFNKMTRDSKKELLQFHVTGAAEENKALHDLCREIVEISVNGLQPLTAEYAKNNKGAKNTTLEFIINPGKSNDHSSLYFKHARNDVELIIVKSKVTLEQFREGLKGKINPDGTVEVDPNQASMDDYYNDDDEQDDEEDQEDEQQLPFSDPPKDEHDDLF